MHPKNSLDDGYRAIMNQAAFAAFPALVNAFCEDHDISVEAMEWAAEYAFTIGRHFANEYVWANCIVPEGETPSGEPS